MKSLITSFQPFRGRARNGSQTMGAALASDLLDQEIQHLDLPVEWGAIETLALPLIDSFQPDIVLGLGEGSPRFLRIETLAINRRFGIDEVQKSPTGETIDPAGPESAHGRWPLPETPEDSITTSSDAGCFLCNNALYRYALSPCRFAGFFHLPPQGTTSNEAYLSQWLPKVRHLLELTILQMPRP
ncbi:hypothetical protein [Pelagicoccus sp. SDUM812002]|uniref:pyroglutamyl-peptidase I family protein n=1 Tax=Pelagicoccus sp. SDUM812002 TaxID=3041266 RepID=UPI0028100CF2|nr:hypothetical protein [Pelagicoccus sp. SDUM812002]MDQ8187048.1 hypothetical protein [Pelagicoccus sp. SDUM812002]